MPTVTVDLQEGFEDDVVEVWLGGEHRWREEAVTTNLAIALAASVPLEAEAGESELRVAVTSRGVEATQRLAVEQDVTVAVNLADGSVRLEPLAERPYYL
jgi:hypothetical protein